MVNVAHDHHDGGAGDQIFGLILCGVNQLFLNGDDHFMLHFAAHVFGNDGGRVEVDHLAHRGHDAVLHQGFYHFRTGFFHAGKLTRPR